METTSFLIMAYAIITTDPSTIYPIYPPHEELHVIDVATPIIMDQTSCLNLIDDPYFVYLFEQELDRKVLFHSENIFVEPRPYCVSAMNDGDVDSYGLGDPYYWQEPAPEK